MDLPASVRLAAYENFFKIIKLMKEASFKKHFNQILELVWCLVMKSESTIESIEM